MLNDFLWNRWGPNLPRVEFCRFKTIEFFPEMPPRFDQIESICIGSKTRTIGDPLVLSTLPAKLKSLYPHLKIYTYPRGFNPVIFAGNPAVSGVQWLPDTVFGDDCNQGPGHLIQRKERFFGVPVSEATRPDLYLLPREKAWLQDFLKQATPNAAHQPLCIIHPWGKTHPTVLSAALWEQVVREHQGRVRFWQVGIEGHTPIAGCERHLLMPRAYPHARKLFAVLSRADLFIGVDSGPMHIARAFEVPSLVLTDYGKTAEDIFAERAKALPPAQTNFHHCFIYEENTNLDVPGHSGEALLDRMRGFIHGLKSSRG